VGVVAEERHPLGGEVDAAEERGGEDEVHGQGLRWVEDGLLYTQLRCPLPPSDLFITSPTLKNLLEINSSVL
jgi:hypothetical protein